MLPQSRIASRGRSRGRGSETAQGTDAGRGPRTGDATDQRTEDGMCQGTVSVTTLETRIGRGGATIHGIGTEIGIERRGRSGTDQETRRGIDDETAQETAVDIALVQGSKNVIGDGIVRRTGALVLPTRTAQNVVPALPLVQPLRPESEANEPVHPRALPCRAPRSHFPRKNCLSAVPTTASLHLPSTAERPPPWRNPTSSPRAF
jgi:hypothetical protein